MQNKILGIVSILVLSSCVSNPADDRFTAEELAPETTVNAALDQSSIDAQLVSVEAQLAAAQSRLEQYQSQSAADLNQSLISGAEAEILHYQTLKNNLMSRKQEINSSSSVQ